MVESPVVRALLAALALMVAAGCAAPAAPADPVAQAPQTRTVITERGPVEVPADPQRIAVLNGSLADYLYALDAPVSATDVRVLGVVNDAAGFPPSWSAAAQAQGTTGLPGGDELSIESVAAAEPDLIIGGGQGLPGVQATDAYGRLSGIAPTLLVPTTATSWQEQLALVAEFTGRADRVAALVQRYDERVAQVRAAITTPTDPVVFIASYSGVKSFLIPPTAALPSLAAELGFVPDDSLAKAGNPPLFGTGDSFEVSAELLAQAASAPVAIVVKVSGRSVAELAEDPTYAQLPAFRSGQVHELPVASFRPDYSGVLATLDAIEAEFRSV